MALETKTRILEAAKEVFTAKGKNGARMHEIAERAGINQAMLHYYFTSKDKLFDAVIRSFLEQVIKEFESIHDMEGDIAEHIRVLLIRLNVFWSRHGEEMALVFQAVRSGNRAALSVLRRFYGSKKGPIKFFAGLHERGVLREGDPRQVLLHILGSINFYHLVKAGLVKIWGINDGEFQEARIESLMDLFEHGLFTEHSNSRMGKGRQ